MSSVTSPLRPHTPPRVGEVIKSSRNNWFVVGQHIGSGAFADVYECSDYWSNRLVAKVLKPAGTYEEDWARADSEARKLFDLRHPSITYVHDGFEHKGCFYIITERCEGDLNALLADTKLRDIYLPFIASSVLQALHYLHSNGVRHCDLHAGNVLWSIQKDPMIPEAQEVWGFKVGDFGISKLAHELVGPAATFKNGIRPPECIDHIEYGPVDGRVDIYQAALLFLEILTGQPSNFGENEIMSAVPRQRAEAISDPIGPVLSRALRRHATARTPTAMDFWDDLRGAGWVPPPQ